VKLISSDPHVNLCTMITEDPDLGDWGATMLHTEDFPRLCSRMHARTVGGVPVVHTHGTDAAQAV
jgi:hypothetical protein